MISAKKIEVDLFVNKIDATPNPIDAYSLANEAEALAKQNKDAAQVARFQLVQVNILIKNSAYNEALAKNMQALKYFESVDDFVKISKCWKYMALISGFLGDKQKQLNYNNRCLAILPQGSDPIEELKILNNIGHTYYELKEYDKAEKIFKANLEKEHLTKDLHIVSLKNLGKLYLDQKQYNISKTTFKVVHRLASEYNLPIYLSASNFFLGKIYYAKGNIDKALPSLLKAINTTEKESILKKELLMMYEFVIPVLAESNNATQIISFFDKYCQLNKELIEQTKSQSIKNLQFQCEINDIEKERILLKNQNKQLQAANNKIEEQRLISEKSEQQMKIANQELTDFAHRVAHDLKQPIRTISNFIRLFEKELEGKLSERSIEFMDFINKATEEMTQFIDDILRYSESSQVSQPITKVDCNKILEKIKMRLDNQLQETNGQIIYNTLPTLNAHPSLLLQVFQNLISNALKFRKKNEDPIIKIEGYENQNETIFKIIDNGIGIKEEHQTKIFQLFTRLHNKSDYEGSGIGLSTITKILMRYNATIQVQSTYNEGSTFILTFPKISSSRN